MKPTDWISPHLYPWSTRLDWHDCDFDKMPLYTRKLKEVYVIYVPATEQPALVLYVGKGIIRQRVLGIHRRPNNRFNRAIKGLDLDQRQFRVACAVVPLPKCCYYVVIISVLTVMIQFGRITTAYQPAPNLGQC